ncbi:MAG: ThuA domain-containing protein [Planctomycetales bacterium]|nr:ThuA domain-containing protein [Planctomycetales bacterium]
MKLIFTRRNLLVNILTGMLCIFTAGVGYAETPIRVLVITGGCCHDYEFQSESIKQAFKENSVEADITVINDGGNGTEAKIGLYDNADWAKGFDVVIHNECFANTTDEDYIQKIARAHREGVNAVVIHCAMHTYRASKIDTWREFLGVTSRRHDHQSKYPVRIVASEHPIMKGFPKDWVTPMDELYIIETVWPKTTILATSNSEQDGSSHACFWTNEYGKARVFGTTYGHSNETFADKTFRATLVRGSLWAAGRLN